MFGSTDTVSDDVVRRSPKPKVNVLQISREELSVHPPAVLRRAEGRTASYSLICDRLPTVEAMTMNVTLNNGVEMPALGFGVFQTPPETTAASVAEALRIGYRLIDTAASYFNEREVGEGIRRAGLDRSEVFVETKLWISDYGYDQALHSFDKSAGKLGVDYIDLLLLHQPLTADFEKTVGAYKALETLLGDGRVRAIGVSNFMPDVLDRLLQQTTVVPAVNQVEVHPYFTQPDVQKADADNGVITQAWSPMGGITSYRGDASKSTFNDPVIGEIARAHGKTPAQVMLRWHLQEGRSAIPKSVNPDRIAANFDVFGFDLTTDQLAAIDALNTGVRGGPDPSAVTEESFHRDIPEA
jgi:diketogulonate reductase-like aldo/keto reductase